MQFHIEMWEQGYEILNKIRALYPSRITNNQIMGIGREFKTLLRTWTQLWMITELRNYAKSLQLAKKVWLTLNSLESDNMFSIKLQTILIWFFWRINYNVFSKVYSVRQKLIWRSDLFYLTLRTENIVIFMPTRLIYCSIGHDLLRT